MEELKVSLMCVSPIDGRYKNCCGIFKQYLSEYGLFKYRIYVEIEYFIFLINELNKYNISINLKPLTKIQKIDLKNIYNNFNLDECVKIKKIEIITKHDVKSVEYYLQNKFKELDMEEYIPYIHFGLTSQDINTTAIILGFKKSLEIIIKTLDNFTNILKKEFNCGKIFLCYQKHTDNQQFQH